MPGGFVGGSADAAGVGEGREVGDAVDDPLAKSRGVGVVAFRADGLAPSHLVAGRPKCLYVITI